MSRLNYFEPFESRKPHREDQLTRALLVTLRFVPIAHTAFLDLLPLRIMLRQPDETNQIVVVLHDVFEDSSETAETLRAAGYSETVIAALEALTKRRREPYEQFIERVKQNPIARRVKIADIEDSMNLQRLPAAGDEEVKRIPEVPRGKAATGW